MKHTSGTRASKKEEALALYRSGLSYNQVADRLGIDFSTVARHARRAGIARGQSDAIRLRFRSRETSVPTDYSLYPPTPEKAWLLGVIYGDGHVADRVVRIVNCDWDIIENCKTILGGAAKISRPKNYWELRAHSIELCEELRSRFGLVRRKSDSITMPHMADDLRPHFVRGLIDTDGCFGIYKKRLVLSYASISARMISDVALTLNELVGVPLVTMQERKGNANPVYVVSYSHRRALAIGEWLYRNSAPQTRCARKYEIWHSASAAADARAASVYAPASLQTPSS